MGRSFCSSRYRAVVVLLSALPPPPPSALRSESALPQRPIRTGGGRVIGCRSELSRDTSSLPFAPKLRHLPPNDRWSSSLAEQQHPHNKVATFSLVHISQTQCLFLPLNNTHTKLYRLAPPNPLGFPQSQRNPPPSHPTRFTSQASHVDLFGLFEGHRYHRRLGFG
jgi:hypothetical protein